MRKQCANFLDMFFFTNLEIFLVVLSVFRVLFVFLVFLLVLVFGLFGRLRRPRRRRRGVGTARAARALLQEEAENVQQEEDAHSVHVSEETLEVVQRQLVGDDLAYNVSDAHDQQQLRVDEAHDDEERGPGNRKKIISLRNYFLNNEISIHKKYRSCNYFHSQISIEDKHELFSLLRNCIRIFLFYVCY